MSREFVGIFTLIHGHVMNHFKQMCVCDISTYHVLSVGKWSERNISDISGCGIKSMNVLLVKLSPSRSLKLTPRYGSRLRSFPLFEEDADLIPTTCV